MVARPESRRTKMKLYLEVTSDKYELPLAVADSASELAKMRRVKSDYIRSAICHSKDEGRRRSKYLRIEVDEDE